MLDVLLIREFGVEEINAQSVAKAFIDGARMVGILDENNSVADIDQLAAQQPPRRELASPIPASNTFRQSPAPLIPAPDDTSEDDDLPDDDNDLDETIDSTATSVAPAQLDAPRKPTGPPRLPLPASRPAPAATSDAIAHLFGLNSTAAGDTPALPQAPSARPTQHSNTIAPATAATSAAPFPNVAELAAPSNNPLVQPATTDGLLFRIQLAGPGLNTQLDVVDVDDLALVRALLDKIERRLKQ
ncbi:MAG: hypothetical protein ACRYFZ_09945 [Janthinobacterium lividum]